MVLMFPNVNQTQRYGKIIENRDGFQQRGRGRGGPIQKLIKIKIKITTNNYITIIKFRNEVTYFTKKKSELSKLGEQMFKKTKGTELTIPKTRIYLPPELVICVKYKWIPSCLGGKGGLIHLSHPCRS